MRAAPADAGLAPLYVTPLGDGPVLRAKLSAVARAQALLAAGDLASARQAAGQAPGRERDLPGYLRLEARLLDAELACRRGEAAAVRRSLEEALRLAGREQLRLSITLQGGWINPVLRQDAALADGFHQLFGPGAPGPARAATPGPARPGVLEPLSAREREVLGYAAGMLNTAEIAASMYVSVNTVKSHFKSIFRKLGVSHRGEAVRLAQQAGLLPSGLAR